MGKLYNLNDNYNYVMYIQEYDKDCNKMVFIGEDKIVLGNTTEELQDDYDVFAYVMSELMRQIAKCQGWTWLYNENDDEDDTYFLNDDMEVHTTMKTQNGKEHSLVFTLVEEKYLLD